MPPVDPNSVTFFQPQGAPSQPSFMPPTLPPRKPMSLPPRVQATQRNEDERLKLARDAAERDAAAGERAEQGNTRDQVKADRATAQAELTGGVDTTESENTAAFLTTQLSAHVKKINEILRDRPEAIKPGWAETIGGLFGERGRAMATPDEVQDARNQLNNRYSLAADVLLTLGTGAAYTVEQKKAYVESYSPKVTDGPDTLADKANMMKEAVIAARAKTGAAVGQVDRALAEIDKFYGVSGESLQDIQITAPEEKQLSTTSKTVPVPKGYQDDHTAMLREHPPGTLTPNDYIHLRQQLDSKYSEELGDFHSRLTPQEVSDFVHVYNKGRKIGKVPGYDIKLSAEESRNAEQAASPLGTFAANAANAGTAGLVDLIVGQEGRDKLDMASEENWKSALGGEVLGSVAPMAAIESGGLKLLKKLAPKMTDEAIEKLGSKYWGREVAQMGRKRLGLDMGVNAIYGGIRGFNGADEGEGLGGATEGASMGAVAGAAGQLLTKGVTPFISEATEKALATMPGVKATTLQKLGLGQTEKVLSHLPGPAGARAKAFESMNRDNVNRALSYIGEKAPKDIPVGTELTSFMNQRLNNAYNDIRPKIVGAVDGQFDTTLKILRKGLATTPKKREMFKEIDDALKLFVDENGHYTGEGYRNASDRLRALTKAWHRTEDSQGDIIAGDMARAAEAARKQMQTLVQRQTPEVGADLKKLERAWAHSVRIEDAAERAATSNETVYSASQYAASVKKLEPKRGRFARGKALDQDYAMAAQKLLRTGNIPEVSPLQTAAVLGAIGGGSYLTGPIVPTVIGAMSLGLYGPGVKKAVGAILTGKRPTAADNALVRRTIEDAIRHETTGN